MAGSEIRRVGQRGGGAARVNGALKASERQRDVDNIRRQYFVFSLYG